MPIRFDVLARERLVITRFEGVVTDDDIIQTYRSILDHPELRPGFDELSLHAPTFAPKISTGCIETLIGMYADFHGERGTRTAAVAGTEAHRALLAMIGQHMDGASENVEALRVFSTLRAGVEYLGRDPLRLPASRLLAFSYDFGEAEVLDLQQQIRQLQAERDEAAAFYRSLFDHGGCAVAVYDVGLEKIVEFNPQFAQLTGYPEDEIRQLYVHDLDAINDRETVRRRVGTVMAAGQLRFETKIRRKSGELRDVEIIASNLRLKGRQCLQGIYFDITERKERARQLGRQNHQLARTHTQLEEALEGLTKAAAETRRQREILDAIARLQGLFIDEVDATEIFEAMLAELLRLTESESGFVDSMEQGADGTPFLQALAISNIAWDEASRAFYEREAPGGMRFYDFATLFGPAVTKGEVVMSNFEPDDPRRKGVPPGHPTIETFMAVPLLRDDEVIGVVGLANRSLGYDDALFDELEAVWSTCAQLVDAYNKQQELRQERERIDLTLQGTGAGTWVHCFRTELLHFDERAQEIVGLPRGSFHLDDYLARIHPEDIADVRTKMDRELEAGRDQVTISHRVERDGQLRHVKVDGFVAYHDGAPLQAQGLIQDVTDYLRHREQLAQQLRHALGEKDVLLREVHHRVKNNLAVVVSLLSLQARRVTDPDVVAALLDSRDRVAAMALIHETLHRTNLRGRVRLAPYATRLGHTLINAVAKAPSQVGFELDVPEDLTLSLDHAVTAGLVLNELFTNSLKYGVNMGGQLSLRARVEGNVITLSVSDDGPGLSDEALSAQGTFGLVLVNTLVQEQLGGSVEVGAGPGAGFSLSWTLTPPSD